MEESHEGTLKRKYNFTQQVGNLGDLLALEVVEAIYKQTLITHLDFSLVTHNGSPIPQIRLNVL